MKKYLFFFFFILLKTPVLAQQKTWIRIILKILKKHKTHASFFLTGDFLRKHKKITQKIKKDGHYVGGHSDKHLLYADWKRRDSTLVTRDSFLSDLKANFEKLNKFGIQKSDTTVFMPPFEWYNDSIALWTKRTDKFWARLDDLMSALQKRGYQFERFTK